MSDMATLQARALLADAVVPRVARGGRGTWAMPQAHSFDVFDTLISRCWWRPEDLFLRLGERLLHARLPLPDAASFATRRVAAEACLRAQPGVEEVTLGDIHAALSEELGWDAKQRDAAIALELATEEEAIRPVAANLSRLTRLRQQGAEVVLLSDTYLDADALCRLLRRVGLDIERERVFASSALGATKRTGRLFGLAARQLGIQAEHIMHRGDHPHSDLAAARAAGLQAHLSTESTPTRFEALLHATTAGHPPTIRSALAGGARAARLAVDPPNRHARTLHAVGAAVAGPLLAGFVLWVLLAARREGLRRLHFVSRDGQVLLRIAETLLPSLGWDLDCRYLYGSRQAWHLPAMERLDDAALAWLAKEAPREPLRSVLARAELKPAAIADALRRHGLEGEEALASPAPESRLVALLHDPEVEAAVLAAATERRRLALGYLRQEGLLGADRIAMVDLGWHGRLQRSLARLLELGAQDGATPALTGFYLALRSRPDGFQPEATRPFVEQPGFLHDMNPVLFEIFCAADHGTVRRYVTDPSGLVAPELAETVDRRVLEWGLPALRNGILGFAGELAEALRRSGGADAEEWTRALRVGGLATYEAFRRAPGEEEAEAFGSFPHADGQAHEVWGDCAPRLGLAARLRLGLGLGDPGYAGHWPEASVRRGGGRTADAIFALKRLRQRLSG